LKRVIATVSLAALLVSGCGHTGDNTNVDTNANQLKNQQRNEVSPSPLAVNCKPTKSKDSASRKALAEEREKQENVLSGNYKDKHKPPVKDWTPGKGYRPERLRIWSNNNMLPVPGFGTISWDELIKKEPKFQAYLVWFFDRDVNWDALYEYQRENYTLKEVAQMSKEERYKEVAKLLTEAKEFYFGNFYTNRLKDYQQKSWFREKQQIFLIDYFHSFHVLCAKEFSESKVNTESGLPKAEVPVWFFDGTLRMWANEMEKGEGNMHSLYSFSNYQDTVDMFFIGY